jgi:hypothetical protein
MTHRILACSLAVVVGLATLGCENTRHTHTTTWSQPTVTSPAQLPTVARAQRPRQNLSPRELGTNRLGIEVGMAGICRTASRFCGLRAHSWRERNPRRQPIKSTLSKKCDLMTFNRVGPN